MEFVSATGRRKIFEKLCLSVIPVLPSLECQGEMEGKKLQSFEYGRCELCTANSECPLASKYPAMCVQGQVQCKACHRAGSGHSRRVDVFKDWWYNANY